MNELVKVINESGLDKTKAQVLLEKFSNYFEIASDWESKAKMLTITSIEQKDEMKMAREGRLFLKEKRIAVEKTAAEKAKLEAEIKAKIKIKIASREHELRMQYKAYEYYSHPSTQWVIEALKGSIHLLPKLEIFLNEHKN